MTAPYGGVRPTRPAGADLSALQYHFAALNSSNEAIPITAITTNAFGVLQNAPEDEENALFIVNHQTKVQCSEALAIGDLVGPSLDGRAQVAVSTQFVRGVVVEATTSADQFASIRLIDSTVAIA